VEIVENSLWEKFSTGGAVFSTALSTGFSTGLFGVKLLYAII